MKIFNLTDVPTAELNQYGLLGVTIAVGRNLVQPGESVDSADDDMTLAHLDHFIKCGALAVNSLPPKYTLAKSQMVKEDKKEEEAPSVQPGLQRLKKGKAE